MNTASNSQSSKFVKNFNSIFGTGPTFRLVLLFSLFVALLWLIFSSFEGNFISRYLPLFRTDLEISEVKIGIGGEFSAVYPYSQNEFYDEIFNSHLFDGLTKNYRGQIIPALAQSWANPNNTSWRFNLRKDAKFTQNSTITSEDVKFSFESAIENNWPSKTHLTTVKTVKIIDENTLEIETISPDPILPNKLSYAYIISKKEYQQNGKIVGSGPYILEKLLPDQAILLANQNYYLFKVKAKRVVFKFYPNDQNATQRIADLKQKNLNLIADISSQNTKKQLESQGFVTKTITNPQVTYLGFDTSRQKSPYIKETPNPFSQKNARQAVYQAINISNLISEASLSARVATQFVTAQITGYNPEISRLSYDPVKAQELVKSAGFNKGFKVVLDTPSNLKEAAEIIARHLAVAAIDVEVRALEKNASLAKINRADTSFFILTYGPQYADGQQLISDKLHSKTPTKGLQNSLNYSNPAIDALEQQIGSTIDSDNRIKLIQQVFKIAADDIVWVPLYSDLKLFVYDNNLEWQPSPLGQIFGYEMTRKGFVFEKN